MPGPSASASSATRRRRRDLLDASPLRRRQPRPRSDPPPQAARLARGCGQARRARRPDPGPRRLDRMRASPGSPRGGRLARRESDPRQGVGRRARGPHAGSGGGRRAVVDVAPGDWAQGRAGRWVVRTAVDRRTDHAGNGHKADKTTEAPTASRRWGLGCARRLASAVVYLTAGIWPERRRSMPPTLPSTSASFFTTSSWSALVSRARSETCSRSSRTAIVRFFSRSSA